MSKHTPGPWEIIPGERTSGWGDCIAAYDKIVASMRGRRSAERDANARLIAVAPKMLEALRAWAAWWNGLPIDRQVDGHEFAHRAITATRAAIAEVEGKSE